MSDGTIHTEKIFDAQAIVKNTTVSSSAIDLNKTRPGGQFSIQLEITGDGTCTVDWVGSNDGVDYVKPTTVTDIVAAFTKTSGPGSDGKDIYSFTPKLCRYMKIRITETVTTDDAVATITLAIQ
jgi:hypothetical protein